MGNRFGSLSAQHSTVPVILVDGYSLTCPNPNYFGSLGTLLSEDGNGVPVGLFDNCLSGNIAIDALGQAFGQFLQNFVNSTRGQPVDVIAHSMGGLIVRSYLSGLNQAAGTLNPPSNPPIRKLLFIATPHFGTDFNWPFSTSQQTNAMQYGSSLTFNLATWNQQFDDLRGIDSIAIAGNAHVDSDGVISDGIVAVQSASLDFVSLNRTRVIPYCHVDVGFLDGFFCTEGPSIVTIPNRGHWAYLIIRSFLDNNSVWQSVGESPAQAASGGGVLWSVEDSNGQLLSVLPNLISGAVSYPFLSNAVWYLENIKPDPNGYLTFSPFPANGQSYKESPFSTTTGAFSASIAKFGPAIYSGSITPSAGVPPGARDVAADSLISLYGANLATSTASAPYPWPAQLAGTTVTINGEACPINYASPNQLNVLVPPNFAPGLHPLKLQNSQGQVNFTVMIDPIAPALFHSGGYASALHPNSQLVNSSNPAARGEIISLYATGLGPATTANGLQYANTIPQVFINGVASPVSFAGRAPGFQGLDQINVQVPASISAGASIPVIVVSGGRTSNQVLLPIK